MDIQASLSGPVTAVLNFAGDRADGGVFSSSDPTRTKQNLTSAAVQINNAREIYPAPSLPAGGFLATPHSSGSANWSDMAWIEGEYIPSCVELVKALTGATWAMYVHRVTVRNTDPGKASSHMPAAQFVHIDQPRDAAISVARNYAEPAGRSFEKAAVFTVWKAISPPPQGVPLAISDRRTVPESDFVIGLTSEQKGQSPYVTLVPSPGIKWYYYPDLNLNESLVFMAADFDPAQPLGCAHSGFVHPDPATHLNPRASIEVRVLACFD